MKIQKKTGAKLLAELLIFLFITEFPLLCSSSPVLSNQYFDISWVRTDINEIHKGAWAMSVNEARSNPYYKYGIYTSRTLAVTHPEVYLKADIMFLRAVNHQEMRATIRRGWAFTQIPFTFDLDEVPIHEYEIIRTKDFYNGLTILPFLDQRAFSLSSTVRKLDVQKKYVINQDRIIQLNKAILYYLRENDEDSYLIYCDNEAAYIYCAGTLLSAETLEEAPISGNPILIFNETRVWYPLMERDDTNTDPVLKMVVENYSTDTQIPILEPFEESLIEDLRLVTKLTTHEEYTMALLSAARTMTYYEYNPEWLKGGGAPDDYITNYEIAEKWMELFPDLDASRFFTVIPPHPFGGVDFAIINEIIRRGNALSPHTAHLAFLVLTKGGESMNMLGRGYSDLEYSWCALWPLGMQSYTIDETAYINGGTCQVHAYNIAAVFDVAGIDNYIIDGYNIGNYTHLINYVPLYDVVFSDGELIEDLTTLLYCPETLMFLSHGEKWTCIVKNNYFGTLSPDEARECLSFLEERHDDSFKGLVSDKETTSKITYEELLAFLEGVQKWEPIRLPMTALPPKLIHCEVSNLEIDPAAVNPGEGVGIMVEVENNSDTLQSTFVALKVDGVSEARKYVILNSGETATITFAVAKVEPGTYKINVEGLTGEFKVKGFSMLILKILALIPLGYLLYRAAKKWRLARIALKKSAAGLITLFLVMTMLFFLLHSVPGGDPVDRMFPFSREEYKNYMREEWGLNESLFHQYTIYMKNTFTLNFELLPGWLDAFDVIFYLLPFTIALFGTATILSYVIGTLMGISLFSGKKSRWRASVVYAFLMFYVFPAFVLAIFFKSWFVFKIHIFPPVSISVAKGAIWEIYQSVYSLMTETSHITLFKTLFPEMMLPLLVLVLVGIARPLLLMRDHMAITLGEPHVLTARAKGLKERVIRFRHVARCALLPLVNDASVNLVYIFGGGILIEYVFKWPGIGYVLFESLKILNYPLISAAVFVLACALVISMVVADVLSAYLDPRIGVVE